MNCKCNRISNECEAPPIRRDGEGKPLAGEQPFCSPQLWWVEILTCLPWKCISFILPQAGSTELRCPRLPSCLLAASLAHPPWLLYLSAHSWYFSGLCLSTCLAQWPLPQHFSRTIHSFNKQWPISPLRWSPLGLYDKDAMSVWEFKWGITNPAREFPYLHIHFEQRWHCSTSILGRSLHRQNLLSILKWFCY